MSLDKCVRISYLLDSFISFVDVPEVSIYLGCGLTCIHFDLFDQTNVSRNVIIKVLICTFDFYEKKIISIQIFIIHQLNTVNSEQMNTFKGRFDGAKNFFE